MDVDLFVLNDRICFVTRNTSLAYGKSCSEISLKRCRERTVEIVGKWGLELT